MQCLSPSTLSCSLDWTSLSSSEESLVLHLTGGNGEGERGERDKIGQ